jgi:pyridoxine 4-dehydrogenase
MDTTLTHDPLYALADDVTINRLGYGAMRITGEGIWGPPKDKAEAIRVLQKCIDLQINFIDTADSYGPYISEELIAEALHPYPKDLVIATKGGLLRTGPDQWPVDASPSHLQKALEGSLKRLKLDQIFLYQLHRFDDKVPMEKTLDFLKGSQEKGLIKHIGLSEVGVKEIKKAMEAVTVVSVQNMYSYGNRKWEDVLTFCEENDIAFIPWYPMDGGNVEGTKKLEVIAKKYEASTHQIALSWLLHHSPDILLIPGTSSVNHLEENVKAGELMLTEEDMKFLG